MLGVPAVIVLLTAVILWNEPEREGISRAAVYKAAALSVIDAGQCCEEAEEEQSCFPAGDQESWYVKYADVLYRRGILSREMTPADSGTAEGLLTFREAEYVAEQLGQLLAGDDWKGAGIAAGKRKQDSPFPAEEWWRLYRDICETAGERTGKPSPIEEIDLQIYGTPDNLPGAEAWTASTNHGTYGFEGLALGRYLDSEVRALVRDHEIVCVLEQVSRDIVCRNMWITEISDEGVTGYLGDITRTFPTERNIRDRESMVNQLADLHLSEGRVEKVVLKKERITAKVLSIQEDAIELEGYGPVELDENFCVYKTYGRFERQDMSQILVGYDTQEFVASEGRLCAALIVRTFDADTIRVLLTDTGFQSLLHPNVELEFFCDGTMVQGEKETVFHRGEVMSFDAEDEIFDEGRLVFQPADTNAGIGIRSIQRGGEMPVYPGRIEISREDGGLAVVNDLYLEEYLKRVVPSEMPAGYEKEALKAQAVCARTYAYRQIQSNTYMEYGAHVDDSTRFQVYNNSGRGDTADAAVNETYGEFLMYGDKVADTYYFSTSCGHTADVSVWGDDLTEFPYLSSKAVRKGGGRLDLTTNDAFGEFIKGCPEGFESGYGMYRWTAKITSSQLEEKFPQLGTITKAAMAERGEGGIGKVLVIEGTEGSKRIQGEGQIRSALGSPSLEIRRQDGKVLTGWSALPSAFIAIERSQPDENQVTVFTIYGGGYGHGIGMSQNGAQAMAEQGWNYREILDFFYEGTQLEALY